MDEQHHYIRLYDKRTGRLVEKARDVQQYRWLGDRLEVTFDSGRVFTYGSNNVDVRTGTPEALPADHYVMVKGQVWNRVESITRFGDVTRVTANTAQGLKHYSVDSGDVEVLPDQTATPAAKAVLAYFRRVASCLPADDPTRKAVGQLTHIHPQSALAAYLNSEPGQRLTESPTVIHPFASNISQREAAEQALTSPVSIVEGPPGTGKTQTILNIIASMVATERQSVAVVSSTNSAVDNVKEKLSKAGIGYIAAALGNKENQTAFLAGQAERCAQVDSAMMQPPPREPLPAGEVERLGQELHQAQHWERERARLDTLIAAYDLEHRHFVEHLEGREPLDLEKLPLLRKSPEKILDYLAETSLDNGNPGLVTRVRRYFTYGRTRDLDPRDAGVVLGLQDAYYTRRLATLNAQRADLTRRLERTDLARLLAAHGEASRLTLEAALHQRYQGTPRRIYEDEEWRTNSAFLDDYPVILSTCHSLARNLPRGHLVDLLIIDEASQVSLLVAAAAMACARRVVVVGDTRQLPHIPGKVPDEVQPPHPAYDHRRHSLLSSLHALHGPCVPSTMLVEHYRCAPDIIEFCNRAFYDGQLIAFSHRQGEGPSMHVWATTEGNHMRSLRGGGGTSNDREIDVIRTEIIPSLGLIGKQVGYIAPYRLQADKLREFVDKNAEAADLIDVSVCAPNPTPASQADTVHRFQGRECDVVVMSSVVDNSWRGQRALSFADDARLINVAVSRAVSSFVLVTHHDRHPRSRHLADLIGYIDYLSPETIRESDIVSIFDLLYQDYSARLAPFAARVRDTSRFPSENLAATLIDDVLSSKEIVEQFGALAWAPQYRLCNLFTDVSRFSNEQRRFIRTTASVDFLIYRSISRQPLLAIEVDGWAFHANKPEQLRRDRTKDSIFTAAGLDLLRLPTTGSDERAKICAALEVASARTTVLPDRVPARRGSRPTRASKRTSTIRPPSP